MTDKDFIKAKTKKLMMTLEEAIKHCKDVALSCTNKECALEHFQLLKWLQEYSNMLEKQSEQKIIDKVKPKFQIGDFILNGDVTNKGKYEIFKILKVCSCWYDVENIYDGRQTMITFVQEDTCRLWTIEDAKDSDILSSKYNQPFIYNGIFDEESVGAYCGIDKSGNDFLEDTFSCDWSYKEGVKPATKEQSDLLFTKMKEAGWEWNKDKKELKKIEDEEYNGEDYGIDGLYHAIRILEKTLGEVDGYQSDDGILEHKCAITAVKKLYEQKPKWSKDDEHRLRDTIYFLDTAKKHYASIVELDACIDWLKSLRPQNHWKPTEEQIKALKDACDEHWEPDGLHPLYSLYKQLKKLREE